MKLWDKLELKIWSLLYWWETRKQMKEFRERQKFYYLLYGYRSCLYYVEGDIENHCSLMWYTRMARLKRLLGFKLDCKKKKCKKYVFNPFKVMQNG